MAPVSVAYSLQSHDHARIRAIAAMIGPGAVFADDAARFAAALDAGVVKPDDRFDCMMGRMMVGKYTIHDTHPYGALTVAEVFKHSSNIGATKIARKLGRDGLADALERFGFGHPTGVGLPGDRGGVLRPVAKWGDIGFANVAFGQGLCGPISPRCSECPIEKLCPKLGVAHRR